MDATANAAPAATTSIAIEAHTFPLPVTRPRTMGEAAAYFAARRASFLASAVTQADLAETVLAAGDLAAATDLLNGSRASFAEVVRIDAMRF